MTEQRASTSNRNVTPSGTVITCGFCGTLYSVPHDATLVCCPKCRSVVSRSNPQQQQEVAVATQFLVHPAQNTLQAASPSVTALQYESQPDSNEEACSPGCRKSCGQFLALYILLVGAFAALAAFVPVLGLFFLAAGPIVLILYWYLRLHHSGMDQCQMWSSCCTAGCYILPLGFTFFISWEWLYNLEGDCDECASAESDEDCKCHIEAAFTAYILAGLFEEILKYCAVVLAVQRDYVADPRGTVGYGLCAAAGFAVVENVLYVYSGSFVVGVGRAIVSLPLHCLTGIIIGLRLGRRRFIEPEQWPWYRVLVIPVFLHGTFDYMLFMPKEYRGLNALAVLVNLALLLAGYYWARLEYLRLTVVPRVDVVSLQGGHGLTRASRWTCLSDAFCGCPCVASWCLSEGHPLAKAGATRRAAAAGGAANSFSNTAGDMVTASMLEMTQMV